MAPRDADRRFDRFQLRLGLAHPAYEAIPTRLPQTESPSLQYVRVAHLPAFLQHVSPALERRLATSVAVGHTGPLRLSLYRDGVLLRFRDGRLLGAEPCPHHVTSEDAGPPGAFFPDLTFLQLLFGSRSLEDIEAAFPGCRAATEEARVLLRALFPFQPSPLWPVS